MLSYALMPSIPSTYVLLYVTLLAFHFGPSCEVSVGIVSVYLCQFFYRSVCIFTVWQDKHCAFFDWYNHSLRKTILVELVLCYWFCNVSVWLPLCLYLQKIWIPHHNGIMHHMHLTLVGPGILVIRTSKRE